MKKKLRSRYYVIILRDGKYEYRSAHTIDDAHDDFRDFARRPNVLALGIYDPQDWAMSWLVPEDVEKEHFDKVLELTIPLNWE